jgi:leader peptidase (prepilin peptidase)/N-methyltransferase
LGKEDRGKSPKFMTNELRSQEFPVHAMSGDTEFNLFLAIWAPTVVGGLFAFLFGACAGSFLNVLVWRLPTGQSVVTPPSRCPRCGHQLRWHENLPIVGWLLLRGRCSACRVRISPQYPLVELLVACLFLAAFLAFYAPLDRGAASLFHDAASPWWHLQGFARSWPAFIVVVIAIAGLVAMTIVDAKTMLIPVEIPTVVTIAAFVGWLVQGFLPESRSLREFVPIPVASWTVTFGAVGMMLGLGVSRWLVATRRLRPSFVDWADHVKEGDDGSAYPHARREMLVELAFIVPGVAGAGVACVLAGLLGFTSQETVCQPMTLLGGSMLGWIVGGGLVWAVRILGSLGFGREAMGLGDVHLQAAVGAAFGWKVALLAFFVAVFIAIAWVVLSLVFRRFSTFFRREMPFGPHLAVAAILFVVARPLVVWGVDQFARAIDVAVTSTGIAPSTRGADGGEVDSKIPRRLPPAQLAEPSDRR